MHIVNVTPGLLQIPPNGWGAIEKIIWENHLNFTLDGHTSEILYLDDVKQPVDVVHIHVANLANIAYERGIPYYFTMHDHHAYLYGKDSDVYRENLKAIKNAKRAFVPAKYLVEYFDNIPEYFSHGVNTEYFTPTESVKQHKLLCVANNGYAYNQSEDRKGFAIAISAAQKLGLPITIVGPENNKNYFSAHPQSYDKLNILYNLTEEELLNVYREHTIFLHPSELEAGHPNLTLLEAMSSGLPVVGTFEENNKLNGMVVTTRSVDEVVRATQAIISKYEEYREAAIQQAKILSWNNRAKELVSIYRSDMPLRKQLLEHYNKTVISPMSVKPSINFNNIEGLFLEIKGGPTTEYDVSFINKNTNQTVYSARIGKNCWAKTSVMYYIDWKILVEDVNSKLKFEYNFSLKNKRVYIALESKSLGDTLAWIPYVEEFRKKHKCKVICSTFLNDLVSSEYPEIEFVAPGSVVHNLMAMYRIGIFYTKQNTVDFNLHPNDPTPIQLQKIAADILGLDFVEVCPKVKQPKSISKEQQVCLGIHSTAQAKYWNNPSGWQEVVDWLTTKGYTVKLLSKEEDGYMGNKNPIGVVQHPPSSIDSIITELKKSKAFIGISSGLTWLSWATGTPTILISGFTSPITEMEDCIRISAPKNSCSGCWNRHKFDPGDWNWCPDHKDTYRQFECSKGITPDMVIRELEKIL